MGNASSADRPRGHRPAWVPLAVAAVVVPTALAGLTLLWPRPAIEADLTRAADTALAAAGIAGAQVAFSGRDATVTGPAGAVQVVQGVTGVRVARPADGAAPAPGAATTEPVPDRADAARAALAGVAGAGLAASIGGDTVTLTGTVADDAASAAAESALAAALPGLTVDNRLTVGGPGDGGPDDAAEQQLAADLDALVTGAPITFEPNSPALTAAGSATVARVVERVAATPGARLQVDGFVATGPGDGRLTAQELSDQRAATVREALVAGGVPADQVAVRGLGEGQNPVADAAGRRVDITVV